VEREIFEYSHCVEGCVLEVPMKQHMRRVSTMHMSRRCTSFSAMRDPSWNFTGLARGARIS
jgi:hypothetical protein